MQSQHVLICGGGLVGLVLAHGLKKQGIPYTVYERDQEAASREQGWSITIHWSLDALRQMLSVETFAKLDLTAVDPFLDKDAGNFLVLDARNLNVLYKIPPNIRRVRAHRGKLRDLLLEGLKVEFGKNLSSYDVTSNHVTACFTDGTTAEGSLLVGCDGSNSTVRARLVGAENAVLKPIPVQMHGVTQRMTASQVAPLRALDPLLFMAINPDTGFFLWHSIQNTIPSKDEEHELVYDVQTIVSNLVRRPEDTLPKNACNMERIKDMKRRAAGCAEPILSAVMNIPETTKVVCVSVADWNPQQWDCGGCVTLAGDAAGPMSMYRGEGANHGFIDAACLASVLADVKKGKVTQSEALHTYEDELRERRDVAIPLSRVAALDAHVGIPPPESPLVSGRVDHSTSQRTFF